MDMFQMGKFIAELRKEKKMTQDELGEELGVTNKTISRWETGTYAIPIDFLLNLSKLFDVSVNEILSGKRLSQQEYKEKAEENLISSIKENNFCLFDNIRFFKSKWRKDHISLYIVTIILLIIWLVIGVVNKNVIMIACFSPIAFLAYAYINNRMMTYIEKNAYGKKK